MKSSFVLPSAMIVAILIALGLCISSFSASAQGSYPSGRPRPGTQIGGPGAPGGPRPAMARRRVSVGIDAGMDFSTIASTSPVYAATMTRVGSYLGLSVGLEMFPGSPLAFGSGLYFVNKGGKNTANSTNIALNYLELPLVLRYNGGWGRTLFQPYIGGYVAGGVGGRTRDTAARTSWASFDGSTYGRFDGGLKFGLGVKFGIIRAEAGYDLGLANIGFDSYDEVHNRTFYLSVGLSF